MVVFALSQWVRWVVLFFFSSRRRHTRSLRDWSSDVCSSDLFVVGDRVVGSMKRIAPHNEWRANMHLGAKGVQIELDDHAQKVAIRSTKAVGLEISGVDMIFRGDTPYVLEV